MNVIQIGANKGYDDLTYLLQGKDVNMFIAIEPFYEHNASLTECYKHIQKFFVENVIIDDVSQPCMKSIYYHEEDAKHSNSFELASLRREHSLNIRSYYTEDKIQERTLKCMSVNHLLKQNNISHLDILFIDTEGYDDKIIRGIDFDNIVIDSIYYENLHIDSRSFRAFLENKNYIIEQNVLNGGWSDLARFRGVSKC